MQDLKHDSNAQIEQKEQKTFNISREELLRKVVKDYSSKVKPMIYSPNLLKEQDVNEFINFANYCFLIKNNFFYKDFNPKLVKNVHTFYNKLKSNILSMDCYDLLDGINVADIKLVSFILTKFTLNFTDMMKDHGQIVGFISRDGLKRFNAFLTERINLINRMQ